MNYDPTTGVIRVGVPGAAIPCSREQLQNAYGLQQMAGLQQAQAGNGALNAYQQQMSYAEADAEAKRWARAAQNKLINPKEKTVSEKEILPDISLTRVFKWAVVMVIAMALGRKVWDTFGGKIQAQLTKALEHA